MRIRTGSSISRVVRRSSLAAIVLVPLAVGVARAATWTTEPSGVTTNLRGVAFSDSQTWVAVGDGGVILRSTDGGVGWSPVSSPIGDTLNAVAFDGSVGLAVGLAGRIARTVDGGASWVQLPRPTTRGLYSVAMEPGLAVITGDEGTILTSIDGGQNWTSHTAGTASILFGVSVSGTTAVGAGGASAIVMSSNSGSGWGLTVIGPALLFFYATSFATPSTGWAVGVDTNGAVIAKSTSGGFTWTGQIAPTTQTLTGVSFVSVDAGFAVGFGGTIIRTIDGGAHWTVDASPTSQSLHAVRFVDAQFGIAVGDAGTIIRTACAAGSGGCGDGTVNSSVCTADVLLVNDSAGDANRVVAVPLASPLRVALNASPAGPGGPGNGIARYVLWAWASSPTGTFPLVASGQTLGCTVNPTPLFASASPQPFRCLRGTGVPAAVCRGVVELPAPARAPWAVSRGGFSRPTMLTLQGVLEDAGAANATGYSVTNAVVIDAR
jgi:photosystem II stability/assembly factor-like uncharacterized protein